MRFHSAAQFPLHWAHGVPTGVGPQQVPGGRDLGLMLTSAQPEGFLMLMDSKES